MLTLSTAAAPAQTIATPKRRNYIGPQTRVMTQLAAAWNGMSATERNSWLVFAGQTADRSVKGMPSKANTYATFVQYNSMLLGAGQSVATTASTDLTPAYPLPALTLSATTGALTLHSPSVYGPSVIVYAAKPLLASAAVYPDKAFRRIGSLSSLALGTNSLTALYAAKYQIFGPGCQIALKLVGVMDSGLHTLPMLVTATVTE